MLALRSRSNEAIAGARLLDRIRRPSSIALIWLVIGSIAGLALVVHVVYAQRLDPPSADFRIPWWALVGLFLLAELRAVHLEFRRESHTFTFSEIPLVAGLFFGTPAGLLAGRLLGAGLIFGYKRMRPVKIAFNLSVFALETALALVVFHAIARSDDFFGPLGISATFAATLVASLVGVVLIFHVIAISEGSFEPNRLAVAGTIAGAITVANTGIALLAAEAIDNDPAFGLLLIVPTLAVFFAYRALVTSRDERTRLVFLHETGKLLARSRELETGMLDVLEHTRAMFRAGVAEIVLAPAEGSGIALRTVVGPGDARTAMQPVELGPDGLVASVLADGGSLLVRQGDPNDALRDHLADAELVDAVVVPLAGEGAVLGTLLVANRQGDISTFSHGDVTLLETLAVQLGSSLENERLEKSLWQVTSLSEELEHQALHDPLTGLANRTLFSERLEHAIARQERTQSLVAVVFVDIDDFKAVNDGWGHEVGDLLLVEAAQRMGECLRAFDTPARLGGDEFAILLEDLATEYDAELVAERIVSAFRRPFDLGGEPINATASVGVAFASYGQPAENVLGSADVAMYRAKARGKSQFTIFEPSMREELFRPLELKRDLERAIDEGEFSLQFQPIVALTTGRVEGFEALLRWESPRRGLVPPAEFVPVAEETGLIVEIGRWALREACFQAARWVRSTSTDSPWVSVNVSRRQVESPGLFEDVADALVSSGLEPYRLVLEVTESVASLEEEKVGTFLRRVQELGARVALDDFGSGYSSLGRLQAMPLDMLKIDRQFVTSAAVEERAAQLTKTIVELARTLGLQTIAEGIERDEQRELVAGLGCNLGQGFVFARPLSATSVRALLARPDAWLGAAESEPSVHLRALDGGRLSA